MTDHRDKATLERLYYEDGLTVRQMADHLGCSISTISTWMERHGIAPGEDTRIERIKETVGVGYAYFGTNGNGYEQWTTSVNGSNAIVKVHRLLAVAVYGYNAVCGMDVHHRNSIPWDNRPDNIEVLSPSDHRRLHG